MVYLSPSSGTGTIYGLSALVSVGNGLSMVIGYTVATLTTRPEDAGAALSMHNVSQIGGQVIALAVSGQTYQSTAISNLSSALAGNGCTEQESRGAVAGARSALAEDLRYKALLAVTKAMQMTFVLVPVAGAVMLAAAMCMRREKLFERVVAVGA